MAFYFQALIPDLARGKQQSERSGKGPTVAGTKASVLQSDLFWSPNKGGATWNDASASHDR